MLFLMEILFVPSLAAKVSKDHSHSVHAQERYRANENR